MPINYIPSSQYSLARQRFQYLRRVSKCSGWDGETSAGIDEKRNEPKERLQRPDRCP